MLWFKFGESIHLRYGAIMNHKIWCEKQHWAKKCYVVNVDFDSIDGLLSMWNLPKIMGDFDASVVKNLLHFPPEANCMDIKMKTKSSSKWTMGNKIISHCKKEAMYCTRRKTKIADVMCVKDVVFRMIANSNSSRNKNIRNLLKYWAIIHYIVLSI